MTENINKVLEGMAIQVKGIKYKTAKEYIQPFIDILKKYNVTYKCNVKMPEYLSISKDNLNKCYTQVNIMAILESNTKCKKVIGMIYGLDVKTPIYKFYSGYINEDLFFINKDSIHVYKFDGEIDYSIVAKLLESDDFRFIDNIDISEETLFYQLGKWIDFVINNEIINESGKIKLSTSIPIDVYRSLIKESDSNFYIKDIPHIKKLDIYSTFLSILENNDKDIINQIEKILLIESLLEI